jgi:beta-galactosidase
MEGCSVPDNHTLALAEILRQGGGSYDLEDRREILGAYNAFLDRWRFRKAFPTAESLFVSLGRKCYESWQQYMENARINDATDFAVISGWESTAIENHSGIVDNLRNFKGDPATIRSSLLPIRPVAKQRNLVVDKGVPAVFDLYLLNDTGAAVSGTLTFTMTAPSGRKTRLGTFPAPRTRPDVFSSLVKEGLSTPPLSEEGAYRFVLSLSGVPPYADHVREIWVADASRPPVRGKELHIAVAEITETLRRQLAIIPGLRVEDFSSDGAYAAIIASGLTAQSTPAQRLGGEASIRLQEKSGASPVPGALPPGVIAAVKAGTPLLVMAQEDALAEGVAANFRLRVLSAMPGPSANCGRRGWAIGISCARIRSMPVYRSIRPWAYIIRFTAGRRAASSSTGLASTFSSATAATTTTTAPSAPAPSPPSSAKEKFCSIAFRISADRCSSAS